MYKNDPEAAVFPSEPHGMWISITIPARNLEKEIEVTF